MTGRLLTIAALLVASGAPAWAQSIPEGQSCGGLLCDMGVVGRKTAPAAEPAVVPAPSRRASGRGRTGPAACAPQTHRRAPSAPPRDRRRRSPGASPARAAAGTGGAAARPGGGAVPCGPGSPVPRGAAPPAAAAIAPPTEPEFAVQMPAPRAARSSTSSPSTRAFNRPSLR